MNVLIWYKRDLRVQDHPALGLCVGATGILPLYIIEPSLWALHEKSARQWGFEAETLAGLREDLAAMGAPLIVRVGEAVEVLARFCRQHKIDRIISHAEYGCPWATQRNQRVAAWARGAGIEWLEPAQDSAPEGDPKSLTKLPGTEPGVIPQARALRLADDPCPHRQIGGRAQGLLLLESFLARRGLAYRQSCDQPHLAERGSSRLSPYLTSGALSAREVAQAVADRLDQAPEGEWAANLKAFLTQLRRRNLSAAAPDLPDAAPPVPQHAFRMPPQQRFAAWAAGQTGLPLCDAAMRYLNVTGWLPDKLRGMVFALAAGPLGLPAPEAAQLLAQRLTDYDAGLFWPRIAAIAGGRDAQRLADPVRMGRQLDSGGQFTRRWLPELASVPDAHLHSPWASLEAQGCRYPEPIVDPAFTQRQTRRPPPEPDFAVIDMPFARPQTRRFRPAPAGQLTFDL